MDYTPREDSYAVVRPVTQATGSFADDRTQEYVCACADGLYPAERKVRWMAAMEPVSPLEAREQLLHCFARENGGRFAEQERALGINNGDGDGVAGAEMMVRLAFQQVGGDYERPSRASLSQVATLLAERSLTWGAPAEMVLECYEDVIRVIGRVRDISSHARRFSGPLPS